MEKKDVIKKLKNLLDELAAEEDPEEMTTEIALPTPPHPRWKPNEGEEYYVIGTCGDVRLQGWTNDVIDNKRLSCGNIFMTREAAEFAAAQRIVLAEMREWAGNYNDKFILTCDILRENVFYDLAGNVYVHGEMRFATKEDAEGCIKSVGEDRIKKYYFMIQKEEA